jgi:hypothetical protein
VPARQEKKKKADQSRTVGKVKAFFCSGVKASFRQTLRKKLLQVTKNF